MDGLQPRPESKAQRLRQARRRGRRRLLIVVVGGTLLVLVVLALARSGSHGVGGINPQRAATRTRLVASVAPQRLAAPISAESAVGLPGGPLILGGLDSAESSVSGVFQLDRAGGGLRPIGALSGPLHDAAATVLGGQVLVFGGGSEASSAVVQALPLENGTVAGGTSAAAVGHLPTARSDLSAVTVGGHAYVLGGYDGAASLGSILATADGRRFEQIARLPEPARYIAAAALDGRIYAFGGETGGGEADDAIRVVDPGAGTADVIGHLPEALSHAGAIALGGRIYVLGGEKADGTTSNRVWRFDPATGRVTAAGRLPMPIAGSAAVVVGSTGYLIGGRGADGSALDSVERIELRRESVQPSPPAEAPARAAVGHGPPAPFRGRLLIADRGNNRLLVVNARKRILWRYPSHAHPGPPDGFYFPDDAFFAHGGRQIIANEEQNERIVRLSYPGGRVLWSYGHPGVAGSEPGYLHEPDDAYLWRDGTVSVADAQNCRVLLLSPGKKILREFGNPSSCVHEPPDLLGSPNGDTPLPNGNLLISEVNGSYIDEITRTGKLRWSVRLPIEYPSDPQQLGPDRYLVADYTNPGGIYEFDRMGKILWAYHPSSGPGMLNHPSLAERIPGGLIAVNDDYRHRLAIIDPRSRRIVWQYGHTDVPGRSHNYLNTPDGFDLLATGGATPTHPYTG